MPEGRGPGLGRAPGEPDTPLYDLIAGKLPSLDASWARREHLKDAVAMGATGVVEYAG